MVAEDIHNKYEKLYEDEIFTIIHPKTREASCIYGSNTEWCTASKHHNNFSYYNGLGKLYIIFNKINGKKYQFHFETDSFRDAADETVSHFALEALRKISATEELKMFFINERRNDILLDESSRILYRCFNDICYDEIYYDVNIGIRNNRYGIIDGGDGCFILPFDYDMIKESYIPCVYEVTRNGQTDLYFIKQEHITETGSFSDCKNISMKFTLPFCSNYLFPVGKPDLLHFLEFAENKFKKENSDYQANCIVTNLFTAMMLEYILNFPYDKSVEPYLLKKQIYEEIEKSDQTQSRKVRNALWINKNYWFIIVDKEIESGTFHLQPLDIFLSQTGLKTPLTNQPHASSPSV